VVHRAYDSFGNVTADYNPESVDTLFGFTGRMFDDATGLQNNLNRWYDAKIGRWITEDPIGFAAGDANLSRYVANSPTNWIDPTGLQGPGPNITGYPWPGYPGPPSGPGLTEPLPKPSGKAAAIGVVSGASAAGAAAATGGGAVAWGIFTGIGAYACTEINDHWNDPPWEPPPPPPYPWLILPPYEPRPPVLPPPRRLPNH
jgi:RHS repeat-associated protein